jgi:hypothetical protein
MWTSDFTGQNPSRFARFYDKGAFIGFVLKERVPRFDEKRIRRVKIHPPRIQQVCAEPGMRDSMARADPFIAEVAFSICVNLWLPHCRCQ